MSSKALNWAFRQSLKPMTKAVLVAMADTADDDGYLYPSYEYLIYKTDVSQRKLVDAIKELDEAGLIVVEKNYRAGFRLANLFFLMLDNEDRMKPPWASPVSTKARKAQMEDFRARSKRHRNGQSAAGGPAVGHDFGSADPAPTVPVQDGEVVADEPVADGVSHYSGSANGALTVGEPRLSGSARAAPTVPTDDENHEFPVVQEAHLGPPYVQDLPSVSANPACTPLTEPHDDLSHHQSADASADPVAEDAGSGTAMMIDDSSTEGWTHAGVDLRALTVKLEPMLGQVSVDRLRWVVDEALSKAKKVSNPLAFVVTCVRNDPQRFTVVTAGRAPAGGGLLTPGEQPCPEPDHGQYRAANCPACRVEARIIEPDAEPELSAEEVAAWRKERAARSGTDSGHRPGGGSSPVPHRVRGA